MILSPLLRACLHVASVVVRFNGWGIRLVAAESRTSNWLLGRVRVAASEWTEMDGQASVWSRLHLAIHRAPASKRGGQLVVREDFKTH